MGWRPETDSDTVTGMKPQTKRHCANALIGMFFGLGIILIIATVFAVAIPALRELYPDEQLPLILGATPLALTASSLFGLCYYISVRGARITDQPPETPEG